ncbi:hypothetical protein [Streptomyces olivochromogenes]|uniref:Uncharacterized protein n=1 Tax=Streptomyces olivochromogenes TaxID=1963 RepID=A0A250VT31_STROL|nr:hypothetical protein [Streptomyces olivochromogenes]KUN38178.1 hypothetical protein AQJ27_44550 [Streptomyces olivochromogenes]GAX57249.1 hypothetical protein SO3561_08819 [Streptomyces olivochromogenes]
MPAKRFSRGAFVKYEGSIQRFRGTWWTVVDSSTSTGQLTYTLHTPGIGKLRYVRAAHVNQTRAES